MSARRGFSVVELMIVIVMLGVFCAVTIPAFLDSVKQARTTEATLALDRLKRNAKQVYTETSRYVVGTAATLPVRPGGGCCNGPDNHCAPDPASFAADPIWRALDFELREPSLFAYDYTGTASGFTATATGDVDCDGSTVTFTLYGTTLRDHPVVTLTAPAGSDD